MKKAYYPKTKFLYTLAVIMLTLCLIASVFALSACQSKLSKIEATYTGFELEIGQKLNKNDIKVTAVYEDGSKKEVTDFSVEEIDTAVSGKHSVKVTYTQDGLTRHATVIVTVKEKPSLFAINAVYNGGAVEIGATLNKSDIIVTATYADGENNPIQGSAKVVTEYTLEYDFSSAGYKTVTVRYSEDGVTKTATFGVTVNPQAILTAISAEYAGGNIPFGALLNLDKITVTATYDDGSEKTVSGFQALEFDPTTEGEQQVTIVYTENGVTKQCQITVKVIEKITETANYGKYGILQDDGSVKIINTAYVNGDLQIHFLAFENVTSGDSIYIKAGDTDVLIDAGSTAGSNTVIEKYVDKFCTDKKLEYAIATHAHADHISAYVGNGSNGILDLYKCDNIIRYAKRKTNSALSQNFEAKCDALKAQGANVYTALDCYNNANGASRVYQLSYNVELEVLYNYYYDHTAGEENDYSVCVMLHQYGQGYDFDNRNNPNNENYVNHYLFTGDLEDGGETRLVQYNNLPKVVLYKAGHHGSKTSSTLALLNVIQPKLICMCSCAGDSYGFPHQQSLERMSTCTDMVFITNLRGDGGATAYLNGNIRVTSNEKGVFVNCTNNNTLFKDTEWFKANRDPIEAWKEPTDETTE